jgi:hypothetical protein
MSLQWEISLQEWKSLPASNNNQRDGQSGNRDGRDGRDDGNRVTNRDRDYRDPGGLNRAQRRSFDRRQRSADKRGPSPKPPFKPRDSRAGLQPHA